MSVSIVHQAWSGDSLQSPDRITSETKSQLRERLYQIDYRTFELKAELCDLQNERIEIVMDLWSCNEPIPSVHSIERRARFDDGSFVQVSRRKITPSPTSDPTLSPTESPTNEPTLDPTMQPTLRPTVDPTISPTETSTASPTTSPTLGPTQKPTRHPTIDDDSILEAHQSKLANYSSSVLMDIYEIKRGSKTPINCGIGGGQFDALTNQIKEQDLYDLIITKFQFDNLKIVKSYHGETDTFYEALPKMYKAFVFSNITIGGLDFITRAIAQFKKVCAKEGVLFTDIPKDIRNVICRVSREIFAKNQTAANIIAFKAFIQMFICAHHIQMRYILQQSSDHYTHDSETLRIAFTKISERFDKILDATVDSIKSKVLFFCLQFLDEMQHRTAQVMEIKQLFVILEIINDWKLGLPKTGRKKVYRICIISSLGAPLRHSLRTETPNAEIATQQAVWNEQQQKFRITK